MLAKRGGILVYRESWAIGCDLEQHAAWLEKVDRLEPEAIDHFGGAAAGSIDLLPHLQLGLVVGDAPGDVMNAASAPASSARFRIFADFEIATRSAATDLEANPFVLGADVDEAEHSGEERRS